MQNTVMQQSLLTHTNTQIIMKPLTPSYHRAQTDILPHQVCCHGNQGPFNYQPLIEYAYTVCYIKPHPYTHHNLRAPNPPNSSSSNTKAVNHTSVSSLFSDWLVPCLDLHAQLTPWMTMRRESPVLLSLREKSSSTEKVNYNNACCLLER